MVCVMETQQTPNGAIAHGQIADYVAFKKTVSDTVRTLAAKRRSWASEESTELFVTIVDEYVAQLPDGQLPDAGDLKDVFARYVNQNAVNNRLADAKLIDRKEKGATRKAGTDLL
jgi:hypothetical protein